MSGPWRHPLTSGGCTRRLRLVGSLGQSGTGVAVDPIHRIWMVQSGGTVHYGTYTAAGVASYGGNITGVPSATGRTSSGMALDPERCLWWVASQSGGTLVYGTYDPATGRPSLGGQIILAQGEGVQRIVVDPDLLLWWTGNDTRTDISYGTYSPATGLPTVTGTQTVPGAVSHIDALTVDSAHRLLWGGTTPYVLSYSTAGVLTATAVAQQLGVDGSIDYDRSLVLGCGASTADYGLWLSAGDGGLVLLDELGAGAYVWQVAVDPALALAFCATGDILTYC